MDITVLTAWSPGEIFVVSSMVCGANAICSPSNDERYTTDHYIALNFLLLVICSMHSMLSSCLKWRFYLSNFVLPRNVSNMCSFGLRHCWPKRLKMGKCRRQCWGCWQGHAEVYSWSMPARVHSFSDSCLLHIADCKVTWLFFHQNSPYFSVCLRIDVVDVKSSIWQESGRTIASTWGCSQVFVTFEKWQGSEGAAPFIG